jgi:hypothetical protein
MDKKKSNAVSKFLKKKIAETFHKSIPKIEPILEKRNRTIQQAEKIVENVYILYAPANSSPENSLGWTLDFVYNQHFYFPFICIDFIHPFHISGYNERTKTKDICKSETLIGTALHEFAHTICPDKVPHGKVWKRIIRILCDNAGIPRWCAIDDMSKRKAGISRRMSRTKCIH